MGMGPMSDGWNDLVEELKQLEAFFPLLGSENEREELDEEIIELEVSRWQRRRLARDAVGAIRAYRGHAAAVRDAEVEKALRALDAGQPPEAVLRQLANSLTNKLLHHPTAGLKRAGEQGRRESLRWLSEFFATDRPDRPEPP